MSAALMRSAKACRFPEWLVVGGASECPVPWASPFLLAAEGAEPILPNNPIPQSHMKPFRTRLTILALSVIAGFAAHAAELETTTPVAAKTNGEKWWNGNCERILAAIKKMDGEIDVGFVGDSITARWRGGENWEKHWGSYRAVNMGIGGDRTQNVLWRLQNGELDGCKAKLFVVMIGTNNLFDNKTEPADAAAGIKAIIDLIQTKQPQADGSISMEVMHDSLHLAAKGYDIWAESIGDKVKELVGGAP